MEDEAQVAEAAPPAPASDQDKLWSVSVPLIHITDSEIDFKDESPADPVPHRHRRYQRRYRWSQQPGGLPNQGRHQGLGGRLCPRSPWLALLRTLLDPPALDLALVFKGCRHDPAQPHWALYAGYAIEQGVLDLNLDYGLKDNKLDGRNKIVIHQMELGEKIDRPGCGPALELALALLTDSEGVIDMDIKVSGDVNDPDFNWQCGAGGFGQPDHQGCHRALYTAGQPGGQRGRTWQRLNSSRAPLNSPGCHPAKLDDRALTQRPGAGTGYRRPPATGGR